MADDITFLDAKEEEAPKKPKGSGKQFTRKQILDYGDAVRYFDGKLYRDPNMARYNHCQAALYSEAGENGRADNYFKNALANAPGNVMTRNDYALHLSKCGYMQDAVDELRKAMLTNVDQPTLRKNLGAVLAHKGKLVEAMEHTKRAIEMNPNDAMAHRNMAKIKDALGDSQLALKHNQIAIQLEAVSLGQGLLHNNNARGSSTAPSHAYSSGGGNKGGMNSSAYRNAAVQIVTRGGDHREAVAYMDVAREIEGRTEVLPTTQRTNEVLTMILKRTGDKKAELDRQKAAEDNKEAELEASRKATYAGLLRRR